MQTTLDNTSRQLTDEIGSDLAGWETHEFVPNDATVENQLWQVVFSADAGRAGLVFLGSGSSGHTLWTDATSAEHAYALLLADDLSP